MKYLAWLLKLFVFFVLFAFALNNQALVDLHFFFGIVWQMPLVLVVLISFIAGLFAGIAVMLPAWLAKRRTTATAHTSSPASSTP
jgi:uncharacterized integral membrane protein